MEEGKHDRKKDMSDMERFIEWAAQSNKKYETP